MVGSRNGQAGGRALKSDCTAAAACGVACSAEPSLLPTCLHPPRHTHTQVDPSLSRTVVVSTKLDTRIPQFARPHDVEMYLRPPARLLEPTMLGGSPFFTCATTQSPLRRQP